MAKVNVFELAQALYNNNISYFCGERIARVDTPGKLFAVVNIAGTKYFSQNTRKTSSTTAQENNRFVAAGNLLVWVITPGNAFFIHKIEIRFNGDRWRGELIKLSNNVVLESGEGSC